MREIASTFVTKICLSQKLTPSVSRTVGSDCADPITQYFPIRDSIIQYSRFNVIWWHTYEGLDGLHIT